MHYASNEVGKIAFDSYFYLILRSNKNYVFNFTGIQNYPCLLELSVAVFSRLSSSISSVIRKY